MSSFEQHVSRLMALLLISVPRIHCFLYPPPSVCVESGRGSTRSQIRIFTSQEDTERSPTAIFKDTLHEQEGKFKILTCMSTACCQRRKALGMDSLATFGAMYERAMSTNVHVEESPCLGSCKLAPCIGIEHEDYVGCVALEGMNNQEFDAKAFHNVITEEDADRVWSCIENAVQLMIAAEDQDEK